ncbi:MAG: c-type cytochrome [Gemmatimonadetes bacterium]|nr:c-type cytochrome [Gemmatimonadota bacterium]
MTRYGLILGAALLASSCGNGPQDADDAAPEAAKVPAMTPSEEAAARANYANLCAHCHGENLEGGRSKSLVDGIWMYGEDDERIRANIAAGIPRAGMPGFGTLIDETELDGMVALIRKAEAESRQDQGN